jgi:VWFA-related protein
MIVEQKLRLAIQCLWCKIVSGSNSGIAILSMLAATSATKPGKPLQYPNRDASLARREEQFVAEFRLRILASAGRALMARFFFGFRMILLSAACLSSVAAGKSFISAGQDAPKTISETNGTQDQEPIVKVAVNLVTTDVTVIGKPESPLQPEDFIIYDNGVGQEVSHFSRDRLPLAVGILVDCSLTTDPYLAVLQIAAASALRRLEPGDQVTLYSFNEFTKRVVDLTDDRLLIAKKIAELKTALGTNIYGTIDSAVKYLRKNAPNRRRAVILISDNCHTHQWGIGSSKSCLTEMLENSTTLYDIKTPGAQMAGVPLSQDPECRQGDKEIQQLAKDTGGDVIDAEKPISLQDALLKAVNNLKMQYTIGFNPSIPSEKGSYHKLSVKLKDENRCPGCRLLSRAGYYAGVTPPIPKAEPSLTKTKTMSTPEKSDELLIQRSIANAGSSHLNLTAIPFTVKAEEKKDVKGRPQLKVDLLVGLSGIEFKTNQGRHNCKLRVAIFYANDRNKIQGSEWRTLEGQLSEETYQSVLKTGISFSVTVPMKAEYRKFKIVVYDEGSDKVGSKFVELPKAAASADARPTPNPPRPKLNDENGK